MNAPTLTSIRDMVTRDLARGTSDLPALPRGVGEALRLARTPDFELDQASDLAESDPPIAARLLAVANSALYSRGEALVSVRKAIARLGVQAVRDVLFQAAYASMLIRVPRYQTLVESSFYHGVLVGKIAKRIAAERRLDQDTAFLAGLLHDLGRARCWKIIANRLGTAANAVAPEDLLAIVDDLHEKAGADLAVAWQLPSEVVDSCLYHHNPENRIFPALVFTSDCLAHFVEGRGLLEEAEVGLRAFGFPPEATADFVAFATEEKEAAKDMGAL